VAWLVADDLGVHRAGVARWRLDGQQLHAALRAVPGLLAHDLRMHRTRVDDGTVAFRRAHVHLGEKAKGLVGLGVKVRSDPLALGRHVRVRSQHPELLGQRRLRRLLANSDCRQSVCPVWSAMFHRHVARLVEEHVDDHAL
jgi:hypothetical protein